MNYFNRLLFVPGAHLTGIARRVSLGMLLCVCFGAAACVYRAPIQQGNFLEAKDTDQVTVGMTQAQVRYVLGTPMVIDPFTKDRWDYVYYLKTNRMKTAIKRQFVVYFENGSVSRVAISGDKIPDKSTVSTAHLTEQ